MRFRNYTDIPDETIKAIIRDVCPANVTNIHFTINNTASHAGSGWAGHNDTINVKVPTTERLARHRWYFSDWAKKKQGAYLAHDIGSRMEALVMILAHECRHRWQARVRRGYRVWGARGVYSERDADAYGLKMLRRFRRGELSVKPVPVQLEPVKPAKPPKPEISRRAKILNMCPPKTSLYGDDEVFAPAGKIWGSNHCHGMVFTDLKDLRDSLKYGLLDCTNPKCDHCHPEEDEEAA